MRSITIIILLFTLFSCTKKQYDSYFFSFYINNNKRDFPNHKAYNIKIDNLCKTIIYGGILEDDQINLKERLYISIPNMSKGKYNNYDSIAVVYVDSALRIYYSPTFKINFNVDSLIFDLGNSNFCIDIKEINTKNGLLSGSFKGVVKNPTNLTDSINIENGSFRINYEY